MGGVDQDDETKKEEAGLIPARIVKCQACLFTSYFNVQQYSMFESSDSSQHKGSDTYDLTTIPSLRCDLLPQYLQRGISFF